MNKASFIAAQSRLAVTYRAISDLIPDPRNARTHPKRQIEQLKASIEEFGFTNPILTDPEGHIVAGIQFGRYRAAYTLVHRGGFQRASLAVGKQFGEVYFHQLQSAASAGCCRRAARITQQV